jgi:hypothetical protein
MPLEGAEKLDLVPFAVLRRGWQAFRAGGILFHYGIDDLDYYDVAPLWLIEQSRTMAKSVVESGDPLRTSFYSFGLEPEFTRELKHPFALMHYRGEPQEQTTLFLPNATSDARATALVRDILRELRLSESDLLWERATRRARV